MKRRLTVALPITCLLLLPQRALAHGGGAVPADVWSHWNVDPYLLTAFLVPVLLYVRGAGGYRVAWWRTAAFLSAMVALAVALISPLEALSASLFSAHMVQHLLLVMVAAPLLVWSRPFAPLVRALPRTWGRAIGKVTQQENLHTIWAMMTGAITVLVLHVVALWVWHIPALYEAALANDYIHALEHASFFFSAALYWWMILNGDMLGRDRAQSMIVGGRVLSVFLVMMASGLLGALMTFATVPWYSSHALWVGMWGLTPLQDQQLAGLTMWIPAGILYVGVAAALLGRWLNALEKRMAQREGALRQGTNESIETAMPKGLRDA